MRPVGGEPGKEAVSPGRPPSELVAKPLSASPPASTRPTWNTATTLAGLVGLTAIDGSISVSGWTGASVGGCALNGSVEASPSRSSAGTGVVAAWPGDAAAMLAATAAAMPSAIAGRLRVNTVIPNLPSVLLAAAAGWDYAGSREPQRSAC